MDRPLRYKPFPTVLEQPLRRDHQLAPRALARTGSLCVTAMARLTVSLRIESPLFWDPKWFPSARRTINQWLKDRDADHRMSHL